MESVLLCSSWGRGFLLNFLGPKLGARAAGPPAPGGLSVRAPLVVLDLSHQRVENTLLALVSRGWVSMGLGLKATQHRGPRNPSPIPTPTPTHRQPQGSPPWAAGSSGAPPRAAPRSGSLLERHRGEDKQPALRGTHFRTWECGRAGPSSSADPPGEKHCTREPRAGQESPASRPAPAPEMMLSQPFRRLGDPARGSDSCTG